MGACGPHVRMSEKVLTRLCQELWVFLGTQPGLSHAMQGCRQMKLLPFTISDISV